MNRMHPGKPPSQRRQRGWGEDWRGRLRTTTQGLATKMRDAFEFDDPSTRRLLIAGVRMALGDTALAKLGTEVETSEESEGAVEVTARAYRLILEGDGIDRQDPMTAESFMAVVERALDDMGLNWRAKIGKMTRMNIAIARQMGETHVDAIRSKILDDVRQALGDTPSCDFTNIASVQGDDEVVTSPPGTFRLILDAYDLDYRPQHVRDDVMAEVVATLDAELPGSSSQN